MGLRPTRTAWRKYSSIKNYFPYLLKQKLIITYTKYKKWERTAAQFIIIALSDNLFCTHLCLLQKQ
jgi:hypothetical protein